MNDVYLLHQIGPRVNSNFNELSEILALPMDAHLTFDGVYESVYKNWKALQGRSITFFPVGKYVGADNSFDVGQPLSKFCTWPQIEEMAFGLGAQVGYHSWSHKDLTQEMSNADIRHEVRPVFQHTPTFAYPGGAVNDRAVRAVAEAGYGSAYSVHQGDGSQFQLKRKYLNW